MDVLLETERLRLRRFTEQDADNLVMLDSDPTVMHFINGGRATPRTEVEEQILPRYIRYYEQGNGYGFWAIDEKASGHFLGWVHFRPGPDAPADEPELGYRLRALAWGKGYATEASRALIDHGFRALGAQRVTASTMFVNVRSRRVMEKCGLTLVRVFHQEWPDAIVGDEQGDVEYALTRAEWERLPSRRTLT